MLPKYVAKLSALSPLSNSYSPPPKTGVLAAHHLKLPDPALAEGFYSRFNGPAYETAAKSRFLRNAGEDFKVRMSKI